MTFSILAKDSQSIGIGVVSGSKEVQRRVPWIKSKVGAIATQGYTEIMYGRVGLELLEEGFDPPDILEKLLNRDNSPNKRQVAILGFSGISAYHTGNSCLPEGGEKSGDNYTAIGNMLENKYTILKMGRVFTKEKGSLSERIYSALKRGAEKGGDLRGNKTAAIVVKGKENVNLGVDYSETPLRDLEEMMI